MLQRRCGAAFVWRQLGGQNLRRNFCQTAEAVEAPQTQKKRKGANIDLAERRRILEAAASDLGVKKMEDWYLVPRSAIRAHQAACKIHNYYNNSTSKMITTIFPEHAWNPRSFIATPRRMWKDRSNHRKLLDDIGKALGVTKLDDWYTITTADADEMGARGLLTKHYKHSLINALKENYPNHQWLPWRFKKINQGWWNSIDNQKLFLEWATERLNVRSLDEWYLKSGDDIVDLGGRTLLKRYKSSLATMLRNIYKDHTWEEWRFAATPKKPSSDYVTGLLNSAGQQLGVKSMEDWYNISSLDFQRVAGRSYNRRDSGSLIEMLRLGYPEHQFDAHRFVKKNLGD
eukprot:TRINITY_DN8836_c0_g1_i1.p1 TRINITY_DN8836_c0_g1~~TRINITY_DN8836_c0_g1_i1.p1  ORF type:complete len:344 (-),score=54.35 TRINITY_DN8836_c0_g1_i1:1059-2090(-)